MKRGAPLTYSEALALKPGDTVWMVYHNGEHDRNRINEPVTLESVGTSGRAVNLNFDVGGYDINLTDYDPHRPVYSEMCGTGDGYLYHCVEEPT